MIYLSKGIAEKESTENLIKVCRGDYTCGDGMFIVQTKFKATYRDLLGYGQVRFDRCRKESYRLRDQDYVLEHSGLKVSSLSRPLCPPETVTEYKTHA